MYGGGSPYYGGGMYGSTYRGFGSPGSFTQQAEDNTRQAFQSVESIVRAFTSVCHQNFSLCDCGKNFALEVALARK